MKKKKKKKGKRKKVSPRCCSVELDWAGTLAGSCMHQTSLQQFHLPTRNFIVALPSSLNIPSLRLCTTPPRFASVRASLRGH